MEGQYNLRSPAVKRLMKEAQELAEPTEQYYAHPLEDNLFEWHFTIRGPADSDFDGGIYHGRIILPPDYPMKPPSIVFLTPNGRFSCGMKICLSISKHHPESWQPSWSIRTALLAIIGFMPSPGHGAIGSLDYTPQERKSLAKRSCAFQCPHCGDVSNKLLPLTSDSAETREEIQSLAAQLSMQGESKAKKTDGDAEATSTQSTQQEPQATESATTAESGEPRGETETVSQERTTPRSTPHHRQPIRDNVEPVAGGQAGGFLDTCSYRLMVFIAAIIAFLIIRRILKSPYLLQFFDESDL